VKQHAPADVGRQSSWASSEQHGVIPHLGRHRSVGYVGDPSASILSWLP